MTRIDAQPREAEKPPKGRRMWLWRSVFALLVLVVVVLALWPVAASRLRGDVSAGWASPLRCAHTTVAERFEGRDAGRLPIVTAARDLRCTASFRITNGGWHSVRINSVRLPLMGRTTGASLRAYGPDEGYASGGLDAVFHVNRTLAAHTSLVVSYQLRYWPGGCTGPGGSTYEWNLPDLNVTALGISGSRNGQAGYGWRGTAISGQGPGCR